jgi:hypothetical protein
MARKKPEKLFHVKKDSILYKYKSGKPGLPPLRKFIKITSADNYNGVFAFEVVNMRVSAPVSYIGFSTTTERSAKTHKWRFGFDEVNTFRKLSSKICRGTIKGLFRSARVELNKS